MTSDEYRDLLLALDLTQSGAARLLGVDERTIRKYWYGERRVPPPTQRFLQFLVAAKIKPDRVMKLLASKPQRSGDTRGCGLTSDP